MSESNPFSASRLSFPGPTGLWVYPLLLCFVLLILFSFRKIESYDLGFHLKSGQWILQHHLFPQKDTFTYTQTDQDYIDSNSLYQIFLYTLYRFAGYEALTLVNAALLLVFFSFLWIRLDSTPSPTFIKCLLLLASILVMERRFNVRPEMFSWLYFNFTLWILENRFRRTRNLLFLLPLIQLLWVNTEGLFMVGWFSIAAYSLSGRLHEKRWDTALLRYGLLSIATGFLNPYGLRGLMFPFVLWTRLQSSNIYKQAIFEFYSPWHSLAIENLSQDTHLHLFIFFLLAFFCLLFLLLTHRQRKLQDWLLALVFLFLALKAVRNIPLFIIVAIPLLSTCLGEFLKNHPQAWRPGLKTAIAFSLVLALLGIRVATNAYYITDRRTERLGWGLDDQCLPVKACEFLSQKGLTGRMVNDLNFGGWLDWQAPQPTFMDGRLEVMPESFYRQTLASFSPGGLIPLLALTQAQLVVMEYNSVTPWADQLNRFSNWRLIYLDECCAIYARQDYALQIPSLSLSGLIRSRKIAGETDVSVFSQLRGLRPSKLHTWLRGFYQPQSYAMGEFSMGLFALRLKSYGPSRDLFMEGFRLTTGDYEEVFYNLAVVNLHLENYELGRQCLEYTLALNPNNSSAAKMLKSFENPIQ